MTPRPFALGPAQCSTFLGSGRISALRHLAEQIGRFNFQRLGVKNGAAAMLAVLLPEKRDLIEPYENGFIQAAFAK